MSDARISKRDATDRPADRSSGFAPLLEAGGRRRRVRARPLEERGRAARCAGEGRRASGNAGEWGRSWWRTLGDVGGLVPFADPQPAWPRRQHVFGAPHRKVGSAAGALAVTAAATHWLRSGCENDGLDCP